MTDEAIQQLKSIVREAVSEAFDAKMAVWQLKREYEAYMQYEEGRKELQVALERLRRNTEIKREIMEEACNADKRI